MMRQIKVNENVDRRCLGALRMIDRVTGNELNRPVRVTAPGLRFFLNRSFLQVISQAKGLEAHLGVFETPPDEPDALTREFTLSIEDPSGEYLPRSASIDLPLVAAPGEENSLFTPIDINLFVAPAAHASPNWSIIRASIYNLDDMEAEDPVAGALLRVLDANGQLLMSGVSDQRGEAAVIIPGIPITTFSTGTEPDGDPETDPNDDEDWLAAGSVIETETPVTLEIVVSPATPWPVDPSEMEARRNEWRRQFRDNDSDQLRDGIALELKTGETQSVKLFVNLT